MRTDNWDYSLTYLNLNCNYNKHFEEKITQLAILLYKLSERFGTRIIWWNEDIAPNTFESEESFIQLINDIVRRVFK